MNEDIRPIIDSSESPQEMMQDKLSRLLTKTAIAYLAVLTAMSVYGAFIGPFRAGRLFSSPALIAYWITGALLLLAALALSRNIAAKIIYIGLIAVLTGSLAGSRQGHKFYCNLLGTDKVYAGDMTIYKGQIQNFVFTADEQDSTSPEFKELPFSIRLNDFHIEYYEPGTLFIKNLDGQQWQLPAAQNSKLPLDPNTGSIKILKVYQNLMLKTENNKVVSYDLPQEGANPAVLIQYTTPHGSNIKKYIFENFENPVLPDDKIHVSYKRQIKALLSDVEVIKDGKPLKKATIKVNKPLHFGGYYFYQFSYDLSQSQPMSVLRITSDTGPLVVYAGFILICIGIFWHFWIRQIINKPSIKNEKVINGD